MFRRIGPNSSRAATWRDLLETIRAARKELKEYANVMSQYEQAVIEKDIKSMLEAHIGEITSGAIGEFKGSIERLKAAGRKIDQAKTNEITRWNMPRLAGEMQAVQVMVESALASGGAVFSTAHPLRL